MRKSDVERAAVAKALTLLNDPKIKLVRYRVELIATLLKAEHQRKEHREAARQRKHEREMATLKAELARVQAEAEVETSECGQPSRAAVTAARQFLARVNGQQKGDTR